jgi:hypothetical protein
MTVFNLALVSPAKYRIELIAMGDCLQMAGVEGSSECPSFFNKRYKARDIYARSLSHPTYRLRIRENDMVEIVSWGVANEVNTAYDSVDDLPIWMHTKLAVLMLFDPDKRNEEVEGIGRRISRNIFWLYAIDGEDDGNDPRS